MTSPTFDANDLWDGRWTVEKPSDYIPGLYRFHQIEARGILKRAKSLTKWEAALLQSLAFQDKDLSPAQRYWLGRLDREVA